MIRTFALFLALTVPASAQAPVPIDLFSSQVAARLRASGLAGLDSSNSILLGRTAGERARDRSNVLDAPYGADRTGVADAAGSINAALAADGVTYAPPGTYRLSSNVNLGPNAVLQLDGTRLTGTNGIVGINNLAPFRTRIGRGLAKTTNSPDVADPADVVTYTVGVTGATTAYEKAARYVEAVTADPRTAAIERTTAGDLVVVRIPAGNMLGSATAYHGETFYEAGGDGGGGVMELDSINNASSQPAFDTLTTKLGLTIVAYGTAPSTAALIVAPNGQQFHHGLTVRQDAVLGAAYRLYVNPTTPDPFAVSRTGDVTAATLTLDASKIPTVDPRVPGRLWRIGSALQVSVP